MASEDVIELGSSDDEPEPAPKKRKPTPNAMVHIPSKFQGVTIKPTKVNMALVKKDIVGKPIALTRIPNLQSRHKPVNKVPQITAKVQTCKPLPTPIPISNKPTINPISLMNKLKKTQVMINKISSNAPLLKNPVKIRKIHSITNLPPSITITKTLGGPIIRRNLHQVVNQNNIKTVHSEVLVDDVPESTASTPQWYLTPEEHLKRDSSNIEEKNNKEPEPTKFVEITIEDSPVKQTHEIGTEYAITIEDSPIKNVSEKINVVKHSDADKHPRKDPHSKKQLNYPKENETNTERETLEIEIIPIEIDDSTNNMDNDCKEVEVGTSKKTDQEETHKKQTKLSENETKSTEHSTETQNSEFHPVYQSFIDLCFKLENSDDMKKIVEKKIKAYYRQVPKEYTESEEFIDMVSSKILSMKAGPDKMYLYIKDIVDELNMQRQLAKSHSSKVNKTPEPEKYSEFDFKRQRQIRKLEKTLKKLHRAVQKLEEQEVDFDDDEDSVYLLTERYKERIVRVHAKFCQLTNTKMPSEPRVHIESRPGRPAGPAKRVEKWINRKVPIGKPLPFPDFHDVLRCVREANEEDNLGWNEADIMEEARDLFSRCGKKLQRRRQENEWRIAASRISEEVDPAETSEDLKRKLEQNKQLAAKKETEVLNKYADKQSQLKLEAVEIGDKEAEQSSSESEDDEDNDNENSSLSNKEERKERLKRLIQEKSKKSLSEKKEHNASENEIKDACKISTPSEDKNKGETESEKNKTVEKQNLETDSSQVNKEKLDSEQNVECLSDKFDSDADELQLLQKLHSENEINTSTSESGSESAIAISDSLESSDVDKEKHNSDVISIEDSSYSESERNRISNKITEAGKDCIKEAVQEKPDVDMIIDDSTADSIIGDVQRGDEECNESVENILLASSDDEVSVSKEPEDESKTNHAATDVTSVENNRESVNKDPVDDSINNHSSTNVTSLENDSISLSKKSKDDSKNNHRSINVISLENDEGHSENKAKEDIENDISTKSKTSFDAVCTNSKKSMTSSFNINSDDVQMVSVETSELKDVHDENEEIGNTSEKPDNSNHIETKEPEHDKLQDEVYFEQKDSTVIKVADSCESQINTEGITDECSKNIVSELKESNSEKNKTITIEEVEIT